MAGFRFLQRHATSAQWAAKNPVLGPGEIGIDETIKIFKIGDGVTDWLNLEPFFEDSYLPLLGTAADSAKLGGLAASLYITEDDLAAFYVSAQANNDNRYLQISVASGASGYETKSAATTHKARTTALEDIPVGRWSRTGQSIPNGVFTRIIWDTETFDTHAQWASGNGAFVTIKKAGYYQVNAEYGYTAAAGRRVLRVMKNATATADTGTSILGGITPGTSDASVSCSDVVPFNLNDTLVAEAFQDSGAAQPTQNLDFNKTCLSIAWRRPL